MRAPATNAPACCCSSRVLATTSARFELSSETAAACELLASRSCALQSLKSRSSCATCSRACAKLCCTHSALCISRARDSARREAVLECSALADSMRRPTSSLSTPTSQRSEASSSSTTPDSAAIDCLILPISARMKSKTCCVSVSNSSCSRLLFSIRITVSLRRANSASLALRAHDCSVGAVCGMVFAGRRREIVRFKARVSDACLALPDAGCVCRQGAAGVPLD